ncbi:MAG: DPP IV N-terminal domain-containing protein [Gammaproteobacteria bacterium]
MGILTRNTCGFLLLAFLVRCTEPSAPASDTTDAVALSDYQRAESFLSPNTRELVSGEILVQYWQPDDRLIFQRSTPEGSEYQIFDSATGNTTALFDEVLFTRALAEFSDAELDANDLTLRDLKVNDTLDTLTFRHDGNEYSLDLLTMALEQLPEAAEDEFLSPDRRWAAYIDDFNLWVRNTQTNERVQLTTDGEEYYGYATNNAGWTRDDGPVLKWSPDSNKIATFRHDGRNVGEMYLYTTQVGHPELDAWKYPLPGDEHIFMLERVIIHIEPEPTLVRLDMPPDPQRSTTTDHVAGRGGVFLDVEWSANSDQLAFVSSSRDHKIATLRVADPDTGAVRDVFTESVDTYYESGFEYDSPNWRLLQGSNEFVWFSERDNWGHLYLYDLGTGELKQQITSGDWSVLNVEHIDTQAREIYFRAASREEGSPYYHYLYRINFDGSEMTMLTPGQAHHEITWSDSKAYFTDEFSTPTEPAQAMVRDRDGNEVTLLAQTDISALEDSGWVPPEPFVVKARDGQTDLYGLLYRPSNFDPSQQYPVLNYLYPGPQSGSVGSRSFQASRRDKQAVAELGFFVVEVDAMGTPGRSKSFHDAYYGNMGDNGLPDQIATIRQLAEIHPAMDLDRVGIWGHSGGGFASTAGILRYPDFYKVAVSGAGNHDNRNYEDDWAEKWQGLLEVLEETDSPATGTNYDNQANQLLAGNLQGKLLLAHGLLDDNVHPTNTFLVVQALIEAEKEFDLVVFPEARHGFGNGRYFMKRRWDYFVRHLKNTEPPADFRFADNIP